MLKGICYNFLRGIYYNFCYKEFVTINYCTFESTIKSKNSFRNKLKNQLFLFGKKMFASTWQMSKVALM